MTACNLPRYCVGCESLDRKSTRLNSSHRCISYAVFCLKKKNMLLPGKQGRLVAAGVADFGDAMLAQLEQLDGAKGRLDVARAQRGPHARTDGTGALGAA